MGRMPMTVALPHLHADHPVPVEWFVTLQSMCAVDEVTVVAKVLPYGMWWDAIRPDVTLVIDQAEVHGVPSMPAGVLDDGRWRPIVAADVDAARTHMPWLAAAFDRTGVAV